MPITQIRTSQLTGSFGSFAGTGAATERGKIDDQLPKSATGSIAAVDLNDGLSHIASAIKRIHGGLDFSNQTAGEFSHSITPVTPDGAALGSAAKEWSDLYLADAGVINLGEGQDVTLTHVADTGVLLNSTRQIQFTDADSHISNPGAGLKLTDHAVIEVEAATSIQLDSPVVDFEDDGVILQFGDGDDVTLTHVHDVGLILNSSKQLQFGDNATHIAQSADGNLKLTSDESIELSVGSQGAKITGTVPKITIGDAGAEDTILAFDGNAQDFHVGLDDTDDKLKIGLGLVPGTTPNMELNSADRDVKFFGDVEVAGGKVTLSNGAIIDSESAGELQLTEDLVITTGDLRVEGGDIFRGSTAALNVGTDIGANALTLGGATSEVLVPGSLIVQGATTTLTSSNTVIQDAIVGLATSGSEGYGPAAAGRGFVFGGGSLGDAQKVMYYDNTVTGFVFATSKTSPASASFAAPDSHAPVRAGQFELSSVNNRIYLDTDVKIDAAADIVLDAAGANVKPASNDQCALGVSGTAFSDLFLASGGVVDFNEGDVTLTHAANLLTVGGGELRMNAAQKVEFGGNTDFIQKDTDLIVVGAADIDLRAGGAEINIRGGGTNDYLHLHRASTTVGYLNFTADDSSAEPVNGSGGFGLRNNAGAMQFKNSGGSWANIASTAGAAQKASLTITGASIAANSNVNLNLDCSGVSAAETDDRVDVYVNGQLLLSGAASGLAGGTVDYSLDGDLSAATDVKFGFTLVADDVVVGIVR